MVSSEKPTSNNKSYLVRKERGYHPLQSFSQSLLQTMSDASANLSTTLVISAPHSPVYIPSSLSPLPLPIVLQPAMLTNLHWVPEPISPNTALVVLKLNNQGIPSFTLTTNIARGLTETIKTWNDTYEKEELHLKNHIRGLEDCILHYEENFNMPPEGYIKNQYYPDLAIPIRNGIFQPAKWIKLLDNGYIAMFASDDGPSSSLVISALHAQPDFSSTAPIEPLPVWYKAILMGPVSAYHTYCHTLSHPQQWGI